MRVLKIVAAGAAVFGALLLIAALTLHTVRTLPYVERPPTIFEQYATVQTEIDRGNR